ncbi:Conserved_hypothetical protein [Hexamita inflata]|uniref:TsaA-like domain-containing protein n=1 Tax=Hexamita inflata TaxID=28002 RepID=A0AA86Q913_9EUKA|nr:Conserved hypothetical protein [Hexamita inflata]
MNQYISYHQTNYFKYAQQIKDLEDEIESDKNKLAQLKFNLKNPDKQYKTIIQKQQPSELLITPYVLTPLGFISNNLNRKFEAARQPLLGDLTEQLSYLILKSSALEPQSYYIFQFAFDRNFSFRNSVLAPKQTRRVGLFSSRAPHRPNPIGQSIGFVESVQNEQGEFAYQIRGLDLLNGTPLLSATKYREEFDLPNARGGWMQVDAENQKLIPLYYDETNKKQTFGEVFEGKYVIKNMDEFKNEFEFIQQKVNIQVEMFIKNMLERVPVLSRTHKVTEKNNGQQVIAIGSFRVYYNIEQNEITLAKVGIVLDDEEINNTKEFDPESKMCAEFIEKFRK